MPLNTSLYIELLIAIMGPIFQCLACIILILLFPRLKNEIIVYHQYILVFNLLPIYPLDGGKIIVCLLEIIFPFQFSLKLIVNFSYIIVFLLCMNPTKITINRIITISFLLYLITKEKRRLKNAYQKFLLERYLKNINFKKSTIVDDEKKFYRNKRHLIKKGDNYYTEKDYLIKKYKN